MQLAASRASAIAHTRRGDDASEQLLGLMIVSLVPAVFWTALVAAVGAGLGYDVSPATLVTFGTAVVAFLAATGSALLART